MTNWQEVKLGDVCTQITDGVHNTVRDNSNGDCFLLSCKNLKNGQIVIGENERKIDLDTLQNLRKRTKTAKGDVLLSSVGTIGETAIIKENNPKYEFQRSVAIFKPNKTYITSEFLFYSLNNNKALLQHNAEGAVQQCLFINPLKEFMIPLPPLDVQKKIVVVLGALDDKIELNNKINQNLEAQAQALFKSWFVDFEPFGGKMPDDWKIKTIGDVCASISETYNRKDENVVLINTSDVLNGEILTHTLVKNENLKGQFKKTFQKNDILYSEIRPINKRFTFVDIENTYNYIASTKLMVIRPDTSKISPLILYRILKSQDLIDELQHLAETRSGTFPQITFASELAIQKIVLAPLNEQKRISNVLEVLENKIRKNIQENLRLAELRDALLPKLMSGEINVDDVKID